MDANVLGVIKYAIDLLQKIGIGAAVIVLAILGVRWFIGGSQEKANIKSKMTTYALGMFLLVCGPLLVNIAVETIIILTGDSGAVIVATRPPEDGYAVDDDYDSGLDDYAVGNEDEEDGVGYEVEEIEDNPDLYGTEELSEEIRAVLDSEEPESIYEIGDTTLESKDGIGEDDIGMYDNLTHSAYETSDVMAPSDDIINETNYDAGNGEGGGQGLLPEEGAEEHESDFDYDSIGDDVEEPDDEEDILFQSVSMNDDAEFKFEYLSNSGKVTSYTSDPKSGSTVKPSQKIPMTITVSSGWKIYGVKWQWNDGNIKTYMIPKAKIASTVKGYVTSPAKTGDYKLKMAVGYYNSSKTEGYQFINLTFKVKDSSGSGSGSGGSSQGTNNPPSFKASPSSGTVKAGSKINVTIKAPNGIDYIRCKWDNGKIYKCKGRTSGYIAVPTSTGKHKLYIQVLDKKGYYQNGKKTSAWVSQTYTVTSSGSGSGAGTTGKYHLVVENANGKIGTYGSLSSARSHAFTIIDVNSKKVIKCLRKGGGSEHIDAVPASTSDTSKCGGAESGFKYRPVVLVLKKSGKTYLVAAARHNTPHGCGWGRTNYAKQSNSPNRVGYVVRKSSYAGPYQSKVGWEGHFCLHFKGSVTHGTHSPNSSAQNNIKKAYNTVKKWKGVVAG